MDYFGQSLMLGRDENNFFLKKNKNKSTLGIKKNEDMLAHIYKSLFMHLVTQ